jgi:hypothetical protein
MKPLRLRKRQTEQNFILQTSTRTYGQEIPMAKKKNKTKISKRRQNAKQQKTKKRKLRLVKGREADTSEPVVAERPGMPDMGAPEGFRSIPFSQAIVEYGAPLMEQAKNDKATEAALQLAGMFWNYALSVRDGKVDRKIEREIVKGVKSDLGLNIEETQKLIEKMVERYHYLFPEDIQPKPPSPFMFIRKEVRHLIRPFEYGKLKISDLFIPPDSDDQDAIDKLTQLDTLVMDQADYGQFESLLTEVKDRCEKRFRQWLIAKGLDEHAKDFADCPFIFFDFVYGYMHDDVIVLKSVTDQYLVEFFEDFLIRKMMTAPAEYILWPPALKLFYRFLQEKGYLDNPDKIIARIDKIEPYFIEVLKHQFS